MTRGVRNYPDRLTGSSRAVVALVIAGAGALGCAGDATGDRSADARASPWFSEVARSRGLVFEHRSGHRERHLFPEIIGSGAALFDMDGDGDLDAYLVQSGSLYEPGSARGANRLFRNNGDARFDDVTDASGSGDRGYGMGVAAGDYDNDGDIDLYVTNLGPNVLLRNDGTGQFTDVTEQAGVGDPHWSSSAGFLDYDEDGDLDLFVTNYINWSLASELECHDSSWLPEFCLPSNYRAPAMDRLYRNDGGGIFSDVSLEAGLDSIFGNGLGAVFGDFDGNGRIDIFVANDATLNQLWLNRDGRRFEDEALLMGCAIDGQGLAKAGMGVAAEDVDDDGDLDLLVVNLSGETDSFFRNSGGLFSEDTAIIGLASTSRSFTRFGVGLADFDNDGSLDLYEANGRVVKSTEPISEDVYAEPNLLFRTDPTGRFIERLPRGGTRPLLAATSRGAAFGDVDGDGGIDILVVNRDGAAHLLLNRADRGHWLRFRALGQQGRDALGAIVDLLVGERRITRGVRSTDSYLSSGDPRVHFGLGGFDRVEDVRVHWPGGIVESFGTFEADREVVLRQGAGVSRTVVDPVAQ